MVSLLASFEDSGYIYLIFDACMRGDLFQLLSKHKGSLSEEFVAASVSPWVKKNLSAGPHAATAATSAHASHPCLLQLHMLSAPPCC